MDSFFKFFSCIFAVYPAFNNQIFGTGTSQEFCVPAIFNPLFFLCRANDIGRGCGFGRAHHGQGEKKVDRKSQPILFAVEKC